ncbi:DUF1904 family protein [Eubacterium sp. 1001713B170207_170306_E7]|uniref:DUF1904 family protein n=1 Tax=Eubacterium sp. 1001713B170207_170306_E7 TaxID=2787097 RepID=UPI00189984F9|nr:DUF1904 family protein [Eubacterium sp. 1001713B170207_170306_E7]
MPRVTIHGIPCQSAKALAESVREIIVEVAETKPEYIHVLFQQTVHLDKMEEETWMPIADILWLGRSQEIQDRTAKALTALFRDNGFREAQVTFTDLPASCFYDNGEHY